METNKSIYQKIAEIQDEVGNIKKDSQNPHFKNTYASYEQVLEVLNPILRKNNLVIFHAFARPKFENQIPVLTRIMDIDSEKGIETTLYIPVSKLDPQMAGSAITYAKRYSILAMLGLGTEDDDGEGAVRPQETKPTGTITREPAENAVDTELDFGKCPVHDEQMIQRKSSTGKLYTSHILPNKTHCFGKEQR